MFQSLIKLIIAAGLFLPTFAFAKTLTLGNQTFELEANFVDSSSSPFVRNDFSLFDLSENLFNNQGSKNFVRLLSKDSVTQMEQLAEKVSQKPKDAKFKIEQNQVLEFDPGQNGQSLDLYALKNLLEQPSSSSDLPVLTSSPTIKLSDTNKLGINELLAVGESNFTGSSSNRKTNIRVGSSKYEGVIVAAGQEFSFNENLGEVDAAHGFLPEMVIKKDGVIPEFGGGLCQVSTTMFRTAMNAGFPITARRNHSFAVAYYAPQGTDATIYPGASDLKFVNDSPSNILIHTKIEGTKLYFEFYGTKDERTVAFEGPVQYDRKSDGSMKATWTRHVTLNGVTTDYIAKSTYLPPALFKRETQASTPNPQAASPAPQTTN